MDYANKELAKAFSAIIEAENELATHKTERDEAVTALDLWVAQSAQKLSEAQEKCAEIMRRDGLVEETIPGKLCAYKLSFSKPRKSVDVVDVNAVPDEFVKIERKPMKKEITDAYKNADTLPNWLQWKEGESKLQWRVVKK